MIPWSWSFRPNYVKKLITNRSSAPDQSIFAKILVINVSLHFKKYMDSGNSESDVLVFQGNFEGK